MEDPCNLLDVLVEEPERRRVRQHQPGSPFVHDLSEVRHVDVPPRIGLDLCELVAGHRDACGIRPVRRVGGDDRVALIGLAPVREIRAHQHQTRQLPL